MISANLVNSFLIILESAAIIHDGRLIVYRTLVVHRNRAFMIRQRRLRRRFLDRRVKVNKGVSRAFKRVVIQPDIIIYGERLRTQEIGSFRSCAVDSRVSPNRYSGPIIPLQCDLRRIFLDACAAPSLDLTPANQSTPCSAKAKQNAGNAEDRDRQHPEIIFQKVASAEASEKTDNDERGDV